MELFFKNFTLPNDIKMVELSMVYVELEDILCKTELRNINNIDSFIESFRNKNAIKQFIFTDYEQKTVCQIVRGLVAPILNHLNSLKLFYLWHSEENSTEIFQ